jgi:type I restriction enzyme, S subunit
MSSEETTAMDQEQKRPLTPRLRFPEFQEAQAWEEKQLGKLADVVASGDLDSKYFSPIPSTQHSYPVYSNSVEQEGIYGYYSIPKYPKNSITITGRGNLGVAFIRRQDFMGIGRLIVVSNLKDVNPYFLMECWNYLATIPQEVTSIPQLTAVAAKATILPIPLPSEQQKIADCLSSLDELIAAYRQKLDALKLHKKALMQQLFPAVGETVPRLRFPEFQDAGEWEIRQLRYLLVNHPDYGVNASAVPFSTDLPAYLRITDISDEGRYLSDKKVSVDIDAEEENYLIEGDIALARTGASVGKSYKYREEDGKLVFAGYLIRIRPDIKKIDPTFLFNFLSTQQYWEWVGITSGRGAQPGINGNEYASLSVPVPPSRKAGELSEQQKIADSLSSLDELIAAQSRKLDALKAHKSGLMQQLFPSASEVRE